MDVMDRNEIRWGMIGAGSVTELKSAPAFGKVPHSQLVAVMRRDGARAEDYARRHGVPKWTTSAEALIADPEVNAIYVATPPSTHASYVIQAMQAGKAVYVEKPMALHYGECLDMLRVSHETGMPLYVAYYRRTLPAFLKVKELIEAGAIGQVLTVGIKLFKQSRERHLKPEEMSWHVNPAIAGAGYFYDLASHQFDYLDFLFGPVTLIKGLAVNRAGLYAAEDTVSAIFSFASGVTGCGHWCFVADKSGEEDLIDITGDQGRITLSSFRHGEVIMENREGTHKFRFVNPENIQFHLISQVVAALRGEGHCVSTGESAARTSRILEETVREYYQQVTLF